MKTVQRIIALSLIGLSCTINTVQAAKASSLESAYARTKDKPIMLYCYAANFNEANKEARDKLMKGSAVTRGISQMTYMELPIYQNPDKMEQRKIERMLGKAGMPGGLGGLPCILILDKDKNLRGSIRDPKILADPKLANAELKKIIEAFNKQQKMLNRAAKVHASHKAEAIAEAADLGATAQLSIPGSAATTAAESDAGNKEGYAARFSFAFDEVLPDMDKMESNADASSHIRNMMANGKYSKSQQQELLCILSGHLRRNGAKPTELRKIYQEMSQLDPESVYGCYAKECIRKYCSE